MFNIAHGFLWKKICFTCHQAPKSYTDLRKFWKYIGESNITCWELEKKKKKKKSNLTYTILSYRRDSLIPLRDQPFSSFQMLHIKHIMTVAHQQYPFLFQQPFLTFLKVQYGFDRAERSKHHNLYISIEK